MSVSIEIRNGFESMRMDLKRFENRVKQIENSDEGAKTIIILLTT